MNTDAHRVYHDTTHFEFAGGEFHGGQTFISGSSKRARSSEILEWISTIPYTSHHRRISERRLQGTGDWIFRKAEYCTWKSSGVSMLLLLRGIPGAGKTFLASRVIDSFLANPIPNSKLAFFYCDQGEDNRRDPEMIMRTLVQQLALARSENIELLKPAIAIYEDREKKGQRSSQLSLTESQQLLIDLINMYSQQTIIICIDALDEVDSAIRIQLLSSLKHVMEGSKNPVKIFATTRMDFDILRQFEMFPRIELHPDDNIDDISRFVKTEVRNNIGKRLLLDGVVDGGLKDDICNVLCHRSKGMFQLAALQIDFLSEMTTQDDVRRGLRALPDTLAQAYDAIYKRILRQKGNAPQLALNAFRWIQCSNEPLRSETLLDAIAIQIGGPEEPFHKDTPMKANELLKACQNLLILDERLNVFRFAHLSVDEYLETKLCRGECHTEIAKVCLSLLCTSWDDYDTALQTQEGDYSDRHLLLYAAVFWPWHLSRADDRCDILHASWANFVSDGNHERWFFYHYRYVRTRFPKDMYWRRSEALQDDRNILCTVCIFDLGRYFRVTPEFRKKARIGRLRARFGSRQTFTAVFGSRSAEGARVDRLLLCAARFGDPDIAGKLLDVGANIAAVDKGNWTSLHLAFKEGHEAVARLLIDRGADISTVGGYSGRTPLQLAALGGYEAVARVLLDRGADVSLADSAGNTPLHIALETGHDAVAVLLLGRGADVSTVGGHSGKTPLQLAAKGGYFTVVRLLVERGADVSVADADGSTPLHIALLRRHETVALLLIDRGANITTAGGYCGRTPLQLASQGGFERAVQLLNDRGADVSTTAGYSERTPLQLATQGGYATVARLLIDRGANVSAADGDGNTPLHIALQGGHDGLALLLLDHGADISAIGGYSRRTPLQLASQGGYMTVVQLLVERGADVSTGGGYCGQTPLQLAAQGGHEVVAWLLINEGADVSAADRYGWTALHQASQGGYEAVAHLLIDCGADVSPLNGDGNTPLHIVLQREHEMVDLPLAIDQQADRSTAGGYSRQTPVRPPSHAGYEVVARLLVDRGSDVLAADSYGKTPLQQASWRGYEAVVQMVVDRGADVSAADSDGNTPLHLAFQGGHESVALLLIERGADVSIACGSSRKTPLQLASQRGHDVAAQMLIDRGADIMTAQGYSGLTPLQLAARGGHVSVARLLIDHGADVLATDAGGKTPLHIALQGGHEAVARLLVDWGADVAIADSHGNTPLHMALQERQCGVAVLLIERGADVSIAGGDSGLTPLQLASTRGYEALVGLLMDRGADVLVADSEGKTPLHMALDGGYKAVAWLLIHRGAAVSAADGTGTTPLHLALHGGHKAVARLLIDRGAAVSAADCNGTTPLHVASLRGHEVVAGLLLDRGAAASAVDHVGGTALHLASGAGYESVARLLIDRGADISAANRYGKTPLHLAVEGAHTGTIMLLLERGANPSAGDREGKTPLDSIVPRRYKLIARLLFHLNGSVI